LQNIFSHVRQAFLSYNTTKVLINFGGLRLNGSEVENITIMIPDIAEQRRIGEIFNFIDTIISQTVRKLDQFGDLKNSLLQQMFV